MRKTAAWLWIPLVLVGAVAALTRAREEAPREDQWKKVDEAIEKGLPKTAVEHLEPIIEQALAEKDYDEAIKAIGKRIALEGNIQGNKPEEKITRMEAEIEKAPTEMKPMMQAILANWYWHYFQHNRWRFMQRTQTSEVPSEDFTTWSLPRLFAEIDKHFQAALSAAPTLKKTPVAEYDEVLQKGNMPDSYRPTLYDFIAYDALDFYTSGEQAAAKPQEAFELSAAGPIFAPAAEFVAWEPETTDEDSPKLRAVRLYQELLKFHQDDEDKAALLDANLARLAFGYNTAFGEEKEARMKAAMKRFVDRWGDHPVSARARYHWAKVLQDEDDLVAAHAMATQGTQAFPNEVGGRMCYNLVQQIEAKSASVTVERVWTEPWPKIQVSYRNVTKVYFRAVPYDFEDRLKSRTHHPEYLDHNEQRALLGRKPALTWSADLPATDDYQQRVEELPAPKDLKPGFYFLVASHDPDFKQQDNRVSYAAFWISKLALVTRSRYGEPVLEGFVLEAESGEPVAGAEVRLWRRPSRGGWTEGKSATTDKDGLFRLRPPERQNLVLLASHAGQRVATGQNYSVYSHDRTPKPDERTVFFTDRSLYRPGQTVHFKGICIRVDQQKDDYQTIADRTLTVLFNDVNGKEIARLPAKTNDYGSFSGSFTAPRDRLMGRMSIRVDGEPNGQTTFNVEEYKRPKFQVTLDAPKTAPRLNDTVSLKGTATAYTGAAVDGAEVRWRVVRQVQYPVWWYWRYWWSPPRPQQSQEIAHGTARTGVDGTFPVEFTAKPDPSVPEKDEPTFRFTIHADVTDTTGETRSAQRVVSVGYTALSATLSAADWLTDEKPVAVSIRTTTLDGEPQRAEGSLKIYRVRQPKRVYRPELSGQPRPLHRGKGTGGDEPRPDPANPTSWPLGEVVAERGFTTDAEGNASYSFQLPLGLYRAKLDTQDRFGKTVRAMLPVQVLDPDAKKLGIRVADLLKGPAWSLEPGGEFMAVWGTGYEQGRAFVEIEHRGEILESYWTPADRTQVQIEQEVTEAMRGGFTVRVTHVKENRAFLHQRKVDVPWTNKDLKIAWEHFVSKLEPGQKETWTAVITGPKVAPALRDGDSPSRSDGSTERAVAEMVAAMYDESLDAYKPHNWPGGFGVFRQDYSNLRSHFGNMARGLNSIYHGWHVDQKDTSISYRSLPREIVANLWGYQYFRKGRGRALRAFGAAPPAAAEMQMDRDAAADKAVNGRAMRRNANRADEKAAAKRAPGEPGLQQAGQEGPPKPDLSQVTARKNLDETAFFFPHLISEKDGEVKLEFTMPQALTKWKFLGFAHDTKLRAGLLTDSVVTAKDLMVQPNPPRFLREGDVLEFTVKVTNQSAARQTGTVRLTLADARTEKPVDAALGNTETDQPFDVPSKESRTYSWKLSVPDGMGFLTYKTVGSTGKLSDGEEGYLPVLSRRILVRESLPLPIRGPETKQFEFTKLLESGKSETIEHGLLSVQMVSNPSWYAVMALPYLMEYPYECSEQIFNRLYANALARHIAGSDPKIRRVFDQWKGTEALDSPMEKNEDLKAVALEETPWVVQAESESQARRNVGILFDDNRLNDETRRAMHKLAQMQRGDGLWPWFPGGPGNEYITLYITTGFGRLRHLGVDVGIEPAVKSLGALDAWIERTYRNILKHSDPEKNHLTYTIAFYLYGRSFFLKDKPIDPKHKEAVDYFLGQAKKYWLRLASRQSQGHLAVALNRFGDRDTAQGIMRSIKERSVTDEELGMFWRDTELSWWWYRAPIETQAMMIEAFDEVTGDAEAVEECKVWLLKQKQTRDWKTTKATADAVYALLLRGSDLLASDELVEVTLGDLTIEPEKVEAGTGFYEKRFAGPEVKPQYGNVTVKKVDKGVAWGSVHWQYLEDMSKVTPHEGTPLTLQKRLYVKKNTEKGPVLEPVEGPLAVGDELVVRIVLRTDRDMEYVHMKDQRGAGTEPLGVLSQYKYRDGLRYYESTRDTASHFFIDYLPKGTYVFEYSVRVQHKGRYQSGMAEIQCMYAPEFNSHSESFVMVVD